MHHVDSQSKYDIDADRLTGISTFYSSKDIIYVFDDIVEWRAQMEILAKFSRSPVMWE